MSLYVEAGYTRAPLNSIAGIKKLSANISEPVKHSAATQNVACTAKTGGLAEALCCSENAASQSAFLAFLYCSFSPLIAGVKLTKI